MFLKRFGSRPLQAPFALGLFVAARWRWPCRPAAAPVAAAPERNRGQRSQARAAIRGTREPRVRPGPAARPERRARAEATDRARAGPRRSAPPAAAHPPAAPERRQRGPRRHHGRRRHRRRDGNAGATGSAGRAGTTGAAGAPARHAGARAPRAARAPPARRTRRHHRRRGHDGRRRRGAPACNVAVGARCSGAGAPNPTPFGCDFAWGRQNPSGTGALSSYNYLQTVAYWVESGIKSDGTYTSCGGCNWLSSRVAGSNLIPVYYAYMIGYYGHMNGLQDQNTSPNGANLATGGAR